MTENLAKREQKITRNKAGNINEACSLASRNKCWKHFDCDESILIYIAKEPKKELTILYGRRDT